MSIKILIDIQLRTSRMTMWYDDEDDDEEFIKPAKCTHNNLKEVEIFGYGDRPNYDELIIYFIENGVLLEKITVNPSLFEKLPFSGTNHLEAEQKIARHHAIQHLLKKVPSTIDFKCL
ncbi:hypothetical protein FNV43_RR02713 [Rhamnella rubrinervis]|uniref:FBD domain-containing protein n=1 Tax=Rhamnella rubrinervis TaxID=2594499 RepID=A0A8K0HIC9_9ROSA|nr:hypothetical protein FNV43_RR02713 [Rhamnella rubrinervis]